MKRWVLPATQRDKSDRQVTLHVGTVACAGYLRVPPPWCPTSERTLGRLPVRQTMNVRFLPAEEAADFDVWQEETFSD